MIKLKTSLIQMNGNGLDVTGQQGHPINYLRLQEAIF